MSDLLDSVLTPEQRQQAQAADKPRFDKVSCSQCGGEFGPGEHGYSHCSDHRAEQERAARHYQARAALACKPTYPRHIKGWLARIPAENLLAEAQALAQELALLKGYGHTPQRGAHLLWIAWGVGDLLCEVEYEAGQDGQIWVPPENCYPEEPEELTVIQVLINGHWEDPADWFGERQLDQLHGLALDAVHAEQESARAEAEAAAWDNYAGDNL